MWQDHRWVAMLDPVELADGRDPDGGPSGPPLVGDELAEVVHAGRPAWEALVRPTRDYDPRCGCCPLLPSPEVARREYEGDPDRSAAFGAFPDAHLVRLDMGTGVCVWTEAIGGQDPGAGHDLRIAAEDESLDDDLFVGRAAGGDRGVRSPAGFLARRRRAQPGQAPGSV